MVSSGARGRLRSLQGVLGRLPGLGRLRYIVLLTGLIILPEGYSGGSAPLNRSHSPNNAEPLGTEENGHGQKARKWPNGEW